MKEFLKLFQCPNSRNIYTIIGRLDLIFNTMHQENNKIKKRVSRKVQMGTGGVFILPLFIDIDIVKFSQNPKNYVFVF